MSNGLGLGGEKRNSQPQAGQGQARDYAISCTMTSKSLLPSPDPGRLAGTDRVTRRTLEKKRRGPFSRHDIWLTHEDAARTHLTRAEFLFFILDAMPSLQVKVSSPLFSRLTWVWGVFIIIMVAKIYE